MCNYTFIKYNIILGNNGAFNDHAHARLRSVAADAAKRLLASLQPGSIACVAAAGNILSASSSSLAPGTRLALYLASERFGHWYRTHPGSAEAAVSDAAIVRHFQSAFGYYQEDVTRTDAEELQRRSEVRSKLTALISASFCCGFFAAGGQNSEFDHPPPKKKSFHDCSLLFE